jgi:CubicO group peptidase (beta-lactamase class C family)
MAFFGPLLLSLALTQASTSTQLSEQLDSLAPLHFRGLLYVEKDGKQVFFHTVGYADPDTKRPFTKATGIEIGSIVKPFVRTAIFRLAADRKLSLQDSIVKYFPGTPHDKKPITIQMLVDHRAGFKDVFGDDYAPMTRDNLMDKMITSELLFAPDSKRVYSNSGYSMLSTIIEKVTGEPIEKHLANTQFKMLGMKRTGYVLPKWKVNQVAVGTDRDGKRWGSPLERFWYPDGPSWNLRGNGGMITTVDELAKWAWSAHNGKLMTAEYYKLFVPSFADKEISPTAFWNAAGGNGIFNCLLAYNPAQKITVVAFSADGRLEIETRLKALAPLILKL